MVSAAVITMASHRDAQFVANFEGVVLRAYLCPAGVITIGCGFTMRSRVFAEYWLRTRGHALRKGDTIGHAEALDLLPKVLDEEYGAAVVKKVKPTKQHHYGAATSVTFNCGTGALNWRWATALAAGRVSDAASILRTTATTANGRVLNGLIRRRQAEARLLATGDYGSPLQYVGASKSTAPEDIKEYQRQLKTLGYYAGTVDGSHGELTDGAVRNFQRDNGLKVDGVVGPATRSAIIRALDIKATKDLSLTGAAGGGLFGGDALPWDTIINTGAVAAAVVIVIVLGSYVWRNRGKLTGRRVPA